MIESSENLLLILTNIKAIDRFAVRGVLMLHTFTPVITNWHQASTQCIILLKAFVVALF